MIAARRAVTPLPMAESIGTGGAVNRQIVVSVPDRKLALIENGQVKKVYSVSVGKESTPSPSGSDAPKARP